MKLTQALSVHICLIILNSYFCSGDSKNVETEESLRENLKDLFAGKLNFTDDLAHFEDELREITPTNHSEYDFIVIGAGSAGATIASRLSEIKNVSVLLIEAGSKEYPIMDIPLAAGALQLSNEVNWNYKTESSDKYCLGLTNSKSKWPRGKVMGGSSVLNFMLATRGNRRDYDDWANLTGDDSWSYKEMLKYFKKLENYQVTNVQVEDEFHGKDGPVPITSPTFNTKLGRAFIEAGKELGYSLLDYNGREQMGFSYYQSTIKNGERWSTNRAYLHPARERSNLFVTRGSHADKILIDKASKVARGVKFSKAGQDIEVKVRKEIILSAGAVNSPQILMLSGIGPAEHLRELDIDVIKDLPVGKNLMDHISYGGLVFKVNDSDTFQNLSLIDPKNPAIHDYVTKRDGRLALGTEYEALAYINVDDPNPLSDNPNIELLFAGMAGIKDPVFAETVGVAEKFKNKMSSDQFNHSAFTIWPMIMKPKSRGKLLLRSKNPNDKPKLYANYMTHPDDIKTLIKGIRYAVKLTETQSFKRIGSELYNVPLPCDHHKLDSDDYWECALRTYTFTIYHQSGTCKMGHIRDRSTVVNSKFQVIGIKRLRVADASVMPIIVSAHPNIPTIAIGEKLSAMVKEYWNLNGKFTDYS